VKVGQIIYVTVTGIDQVVKCAMAKETAIPSSSSVSIEQLCAGVMVHTKISKVSDQGVHVTFLGVLEGFIPLLHLGLEPNLEMSTFKKGQKLQCRILYMDSSLKLICLTKSSHFIRWELESSPETYPIGTILDECKVVHVDAKLGLHVQVDEVVGYVHISKLSDNRIEHVENSFQVGDIKKGRVIGYDSCDRVLLLSFEERVLTQQFMSISDIEVGSEVRGTIKKIETFGVIVAITDMINGLCPSLHLSDVQMSHPEKLFKIGSKMTFRVLSVDPDQNRLILTHKKSLMGMKTSPFDSYNLQVGAVSMGVITAVKDFGCIVTFFNEVRALAPASELGHDEPKVGKAVKCQVLTVDPTNKKLRVSLRISATRNSSSSLVDSVEEAKFVSVTLKGIVVAVQDKEVTILQNHLSDCLTQAKKLHQAFSSLTSKKQFSVGKCVITHSDKKGLLYGSLKPSLLLAHQANSVVRSIEDLEEGQLVSAVISNLTDKMCFVSIGKITAVANMHHIMDGFLSSMDEYLEIGQTVFVSVIKIEEEMKRVYVTLKNSQLQTSSMLTQLEGHYLNALFESRALEFAIGKKEAKWMEKFEIGSSVVGTVDQVMPMGVAISLGSKVTGLLPSNSNLKKGDQVTCQVIDIDIVTRIVDLKLLHDDDQIHQDSQEMDEVMENAKKVDGVVELVKDDYITVSMKSFHGIGFCLNRPVNAAKSNVHRYKVGQSIAVHVVNKIQCESGVIRYLLEPTLQVVKKSADTKRMLKNPIDTNFATLEDFTLGAKVRGKVQSVKETQVNIRLADNLRGRIHASETVDVFGQIKDPKHPLKAFKNGQDIQCVVVGFHDVKTHKYLPISHSNPVSQTVVELSIKSSVLENGYESSGIDMKQLRIGEEYLGFIHKIESFALWVQIGTSILGRIDSLQVSENPAVCSNLEKYFTEGQAVSVRVLSKDEDKKSADLSLLQGAQTEIAEKKRVLARIVKLDSAKGLTVYLKQGVFGRIPLSEISDELKDNPMKEFSVNQVVDALVLSHDGGKVNLSLRASRFEGSEIVVEEGDIVKAYVTAISNNGVFISISNENSARVKIANLCDSFVKDWKKLYTIGQLVIAKVLSVASEKNQIECSLKESDIDPSKKKLTIMDLKPHMIVTGAVKRVETFGVFVQIDGSDLRGLCHISEVSDQEVKDIGKLYEAEDKVQAYILKVDTDKKKISLSLKPSRLEKTMEIDQDMQAEDDDDSMAVDEDDEDNESTEEQFNQSADDDAESEADMEPVQVQVNQPLVLEGFSWDTNELANPRSDDASSSDSESEEETKKSRRAVKKEKADKEKMIQDRELELLDTTRAPEMPEDFERMLLGSPNNSFLWIKYMAFQLELAETEKARQIAERALKIINFREEQERLNILVAYLNLENKFGTPETLSTIFEKSCSMSDPKKVHIQMVKIFERNDQNEVLLLYFSKHKNCIRRCAENSILPAKFG
jgi:rRNA biogenesis protein RRP5